MLLLSAFAFAASPLVDRVGHGARIVWAGLDYSLVELYVPERFDTPDERVFWGPGGGLDDRIARYPTPEAVFVQLTQDWNTMFLNELRKKVEKGLDVVLVPELPEPDGQTALRTKDWFRAESQAATTPPTLSRAAVDARLATWQLTSTTGTGFGIVAERLSKSEDRGCFWPVFFDVATRKVLWAERRCEPPTGMEFRNYWYNPLVDILKGVVKAVR